MTTSNGKISSGFSVEAFSGNCRGTDDAVTEGREQIHLPGKETGEKCLELCKTLSNAKGCEWIVPVHGEKKCYAHKNKVNEGSGSAHSHAICWVFSNFSGKFEFDISIEIYHIELSI